MVKKIIALLCALSALLLCFVSCNNGKKPSEEIVTSDLAEYTIVYSKDCDSSVSKKANVLAMKLKTLYGVTLNTGTDERYEASEKEILVGYTNRAESREFMSDLRSKDYGYDMVNGKLCIAGATDEQTVKAIESFMLTVLAETGDQWNLGTPNITRSEYEIDDLKINGESIKGWRVTYSTENQNPERKVAMQIRDGIADISGFAPFLSTDDSITEKVICVSVSNSGAKISASGNRIEISGRDEEALTRAAATFLGKISDAPVNDRVIDVVVEDNVPLDEYLTVMSFNLRYDLKENAGISRVDAAVAQIRDLSPDVLGVQEDSQEWYNLLDQKLTEYTSVRTILSASNNEYLTIYYKTDLFKRVKSGLLWLSDTPTEPRSKYSESLNFRGMRYVVLERLSDGAKFCFVNTHLENTTGENSKIARQKQTKVLLEQTAKIVQEYGDIPSILVGDFNAVAKEVTVHGVIRESGYQDCSTDAGVITAQGTWNPGYYNEPVNVNTDTLDFCYVSENDFFISSYKVSAQKYNKMYTSDHFPIVIQLLLMK